MRVRDLFKEENIDLDFIDSNFDGKYWESCSSFVTENWDRDLETMSDKQEAWLTRIVADCAEKRIEG